LKHLLVVLVEERGVGLDAAVAVYGDVEFVHVALARCCKARVLDSVVGVSVEQQLRGLVVECPSGLQGMGRLKAGRGLRTYLVVYAVGHEGGTHSRVALQKVLSNDHVVTRHVWAGQLQLSHKRRRHRRHRQSQHQTQQSQHKKHFRQHSHNNPAINFSGPVRVSTTNCPKRGV
jgi:Tfp pilus assembly protein FimT